MLDEMTDAALRVLAKDRNGFVLMYGERERPERRSIGLLISAQVAHAPRTVPEILPQSLTRICKPA
jgi:hypothetical protein